MGKRIEYYCDRCKKIVRRPTDIETLTIIVSHTKSVDKDLCFSCRMEYIDKISIVGEEFIGGI